MLTSGRILILGACGFIGTNLFSFLKDSKFEIVRADRTGNPDVRIDALDKDKVYDLINEHRPDFIVNLIGCTDENKVDLTYKLNLFPFIYIAECLIRLNLRPRILLVSSAAEYGEPASVFSTLKEDDLKSPLSHYGAAKLAQSLTARVYHQVYGLDVLIVRPFNIIGSNMPRKLVPACFVERFLKMSKQTGSVEIQTKNLDSVRDFLSIQDVVRALHTIMVFGKPGETYNICSGIGTRIIDLVEMVAVKLSIFNYKIIQDDDTRNRNMIRYSIGDNSKLKSLGWEQKDEIGDAIQQLILTILGDNPVPE